MEKITLTRNELNYIAESLATKKLHKMLKSKSILENILLEWDNDHIKEDDGILSSKDLADKLKEPEMYWNGSEWTVVIEDDSSSSSSSSESSSSSSSSSEDNWNENSSE